MGWGGVSRGCGRGDEDDDDRQDRDREEKTPPRQPRGRSRLAGMIVDLVAGQLVTAD